MSRSSFFNLENYLVLANEISRDDQEQQPGASFVTGERNISTSLLAFIGRVQRVNHIHALFHLIL